MEDQNRDIKKALAKKMIDTDPLKIAEELTGESYKTSNATTGLGMLLQMDKSKCLNEILTDLDDTTFSNTETDYLRKARDFGFESTLELPFVNTDGITERLHVLFHPRLAILLVFDTHTFGDDGSFARAGRQVPPPSVNGGKFYYNWSPNNNEAMTKGLTSSGHYISKKTDRFCTMFDEDFNEIDQSKLDIPDFLRTLDGHSWEDVKARNAEIEQALNKTQHRMVWCGDHDCREAMKLNITNMIDNGRFLTKWKDRPFLWLLHYMDTKTEGYDYKKITEERIAMLPEYVREAITPKTVHK